MWGHEVMTAVVCCEGSGFSSGTWPQERCIARGDIRHETDHLFVQHHQRVQPHSVQACLGGLHRQHMSSVNWWQILTACKSASRSIDSGDCICCAVMENFHMLLQAFDMQAEGGK
jgi:hypothetical protein